MKIAALLIGIALGVATFVWFFSLVPLGCAMNTTGCRQSVSVWSGTGLIHFWIPFLVAVAATAYGAGRR